MHVVLHSGVMKPGTEQTVLGIYDEVIPRVMEGFPGCRRVVRLETGRKFVGISFWDDRGAFEAYAASALAGEIRSRMPVHYEHHEYEEFALTRVHGSEVTPEQR